MKKFIKHLILYLFFAVFVYTVLVIILGETSPEFFKKNLNYNLGSYGHTYTRFKNVDHVKDIDILFIGSSHTYRGFDPRYYQDEGYEVFNLGSSAQTHIQTNVLLKRYLDQLNPKLAIYEVYPYMFCLDGVESSIDLISNDVNDIYSLEMGLKLNHLKVYNTLIYGFYRDLFNRNKNFTEKKKKGSDTYIEGGFVEREPRFFFTRDTSFSDRRWWIRQEQIDAFGENLAMLKKRGIQIILVQTPITSNFYKAYTNYDEFNKRMKNYGTYYNFNEMLNLDDSLHFMDKHHMNHNGVKVFNETLLEIIKQDSPEFSMN